MNSSNTTTKKDGEFLSTLARGLSVLRSFTKERTEMTLSEVAAETDLSPAVARRCLNTLVELGYVAKLSLEEYCKMTGMNIAALNHAVRSIPAEQMSMHPCWANDPGPHHCDAALSQGAAIASKKLF